MASSSARNKRIRRNGILVEKGLTNAQIRYALEHVSDDKRAIATGSQVPVFLREGGDNIRAYGTSPMQYKDQYGRLLRFDGTNEMLYELPKQLTEAKNKGELEEKYDISSDNFVFISPDEQLLLTPIETNTKWEKIYLTVTDNLSKDTTRATGRIAVEIDYVESARRRHQEIYDRPLLRAGGRAGQRQRRGGGGIAKAPPPNVSPLS